MTLWRVAWSERAHAVSQGAAVTVRCPVGASRPICDRGQHRRGELRYLPGLSGPLTARDENRMSSVRF